MGAIPAHKIGGVWRFDKDQIDELMKSEEEVKRIKQVIQLNPNYAY